MNRSCQHLSYHHKLWLLMVIVGVFVHNTQAASLVDGQISVARATRFYSVYVPTRLQSVTTRPLVIVLHGGALNCHSIMRYTGMNDTADASEFVVAYPDGSGPVKRILTWNAGNCCEHVRKLYGIGNR